MDKKLSPAKALRAEQREDRLAAALRTNLRRRKSQDRKASDSDPVGKPGTHTDLSERPTSEVSS